MERIRAEEGGGMAVKVGMASVDREGGLRMAKPDLGPLVGRPGRTPRRMPPLPAPALEKASALIVVSLLTAESKSGNSLCVSMGSGTTVDRN